MGRGRSAPLSTVFQEDSISVEPRINDRIRVPEVRLVGAEGEQIGIVPIGEALRLAQEADLDLVEVAPDARPPVCKLMDYGKFKYESAQKAREARRNQVLTVIKEMKLRPKIDAHDYETKKGHVVRFLKAGDKVKVTIMFRGREQSRPELGFRLLQRLSADVAELGFVESAPKQDGRNMIMVLAPHKQAKTRQPQPPRSAAGRPHPDPSPARVHRRADRARRRRQPGHAVPGTGRHGARHVRQRRHRSTTATEHARATTRDRTTTANVSEEAMPKNKTHSGTKKRVKVTGTGKLTHAGSGKRHNLESKPTSRTRRLDGCQGRSPRSTPRASAGCSASEPDRSAAPDRATSRHPNVRHRRHSRAPGRSRKSGVPWQE